MSAAGNWLKLAKALLPQHLRGVVVDEELKLVPDPRLKSHHAGSLDDPVKYRVGGGVERLSSPGEPEIAKTDRGAVPPGNHSKRFGTGDALQLAEAALRNRPPADGRPFHRHALGRVEGKD